ncbi:hypothetical protein DH2020_019810 [Rehmannia glutinosa]|uniref:Uncharacterized protein n=1 Tax=Rehmannia glutinosa TaxID=99300 RepID=A0ABR0WEA5_REHGL
MMFSLCNALCFLMFLFVVPLECKSEGYEPASNCSTVECPPYVVIYSQKEFEIRSYKEALWVSGPKILNTSFVPAFPNAILTLDAYYGGKNVQHVKIDKTAPIFVDVQPALYYVQNTTYTANYYVPKRYQNGIPTPLSPEIKPVKLPKYKYAAVNRITFGLLDDAIFLGLTALKRSLQGTPYQRAATFNQVTVVTYNPYSPNDPSINSDGFNEVLVWFD